MFTLLEIFWRLRLKMSAFVLFHPHIVFDHQKPSTGPDPVPKLSVGVKESFACVRDRGLGSRDQFYSRKKK